VRCFSPGSSTTSIAVRIQCDGSTLVPCCAARVSTLVE
jgi:hypothetical protein